MEKTQQLCLFPEIMTQLFIKEQTLEDKGVLLFPPFLQPSSP